MTMFPVTVTASGVLYVHLYMHGICIPLGTETLVSSCFSTSLTLRRTHTVDTKQNVDAKMNRG